MIAETTTDDILEQLAVENIDVLRLLRANYDESAREFRHFDVRLYREFGRSLISSGHPTRGFELVREGLEQFGEDHELEYLTALALARGGSIVLAEEKAKQLLSAADLRPDLRIEAVCLIARLYKDRYERATDRTTKLGFAQQSAKLYRTAFEISRAPFPGINAATMLLLAGEPAKDVGELATAAMNEATFELHKPDRAKDCWLLATIGEAHLLLNDNRCTEWYQKAVDQARSRIGDVVAMRRQVQLLRETLDVPDELLETLTLGSVVVFAGHMIDHPDRCAGGQEPRFPPYASLEKAVACAVERQLDLLDARVGYSSVACGSDILFAEELLKRNAELHVVLPFDYGDFKELCVDFGLPEMKAWTERSDKILQAASEVHYATPEKFMGDEVLFDFASRFTQGLAITRADQLGVEPVALAVCDPASPSVVGGTTHFVEQWRSTGRQVRLIDISSLRASTHQDSREATPQHPRPPRSAATASSQARSGSGRREIKTMLFADVENFSKLREDQALPFFLVFLNEVADLLKTSNVTPKFKNTWGDGLYIVFDDARDAAGIALTLLKRVEKMNFEALGLPPDLAVRIGIHTGPVFRRKDPIIQCDNFFGSHVNLAARIEPVTMPGCAYVSEQCAAHLAMVPGKKTICEYVGVESLAKEYGECALYQLALQ